MNDHRADLSERRSRVFVGPAGLRGILDSGRPVTILDVRWALGRSDGREQHLAAHVPGAIYVDLETELSGPATAATGRHPLPPLEALQDSARSWGRALAGAGRRVRRGRRALCGAGVVAPAVGRP